MTRFHTTHHFACGHERTPENTYKSSPNFYRRKDRSLRVSVYEYCKTCKKAAVNGASAVRRELRAAQ